MKVLNTILLFLVIMTTVYAQGTVYTLNDCINMAIDKNSDLKIARNELISAKASTEIAKSDYYPSISVKNNTFEVAEDKNKTLDIGTSLGASLKLFDTGLRELSIKTAINSEKKTQNNLYRSFQTVIYSVSTKYYDTLRYKELVDLAESSVEYYSLQEKEYKEKIGIGDTAEVDILPIQASLANAKVNLLSAKNNYKTAIINLQNAIGIFATNDFAIKSENVEDNREVLTPENYIKLAYENRYDIKASDYAIKSAKTDKQKANMDLWPIFSVNAEYNNYFGNENTNGDSSDSRIMGYISMNLFDGFATQGKIKQKNMTLKNTQEEKVQLEKSIDKEIKNLYADITDAKERVIASDAGYIAAEKNRQVQTEKLKLDINTNLDIMSAQVQFDEAKSNLINAKYDLKTSLINLDYQTGVIGVEYEIK